MTADLSYYYRPPQSLTGYGSGPAHQFFATQPGRVSTHTPTDYWGLRNFMAQPTPAGTTPAAPVPSTNVDPTGSVGNGGGSPGASGENTGRDQAVAKDLGDWADRVGSALGFGAQMLGPIGVGYAAYKDMQEQTKGTSEAGPGAGTVDAPGSATSAPGAPNPGAEVDQGGPSMGGGSATGGAADSSPEGMAKGDFVTKAKLKGPNPKGPDDGKANLDVGEFVVKKAAAKRLGANVLRALNAGDLRTAHKLIGQKLGAGKGMVKP